MPVILILIILIITAYFLRHGYQQQPDELKTRWLTTRALWVLAIVLIIAAATGRFHPLAALGSPIIPIAWQLYNRFSRPRPIEASNTQKPAADQSQQMTKERALKILGLEQGYTKQQVIEAHRNLIARCHPDKGGNDFLAGEINAARDCLLND